MTRITVFLPILLLLATSILDTYKLLWSDRKKSKVSVATAVFVGGFFLYYILFLSAGSRVGVMLIDQGLRKGWGFVIASFALPICYVAMKKIYYRSFATGSPSKSPASYQIFLHYFVFTTGSVIFFIALIFLAMLIKKYLT